MKANWFIGFPVAAGAWLRTVQTGAPANLRLFDPADLHLTLAFLGPIEPDLAFAAWSFAQTCTCRAATVTLGSLQPFGPPRRPSAFSFELEQGREAIIDCMLRCQPAILAEAGRPEDPWPLPRPHITIARPPRKASASQHQAFLAWANAVMPPPDAIRLGELALYTWADDRKLRQFRIAASQQLMDA